MRRTNKTPIIINFVRRLPIPPSSGVLAELAARAWADHKIEQHSVPDSNFMDALQALLSRRRGLALLTSPGRWRRLLVRRRARSVMCITDAQVNVRLG
jgi:hypothetical protein